ncbi:hypothetical protein MRX96_031328 [Rhipicephalus microplus]
MGPTTSPADTNARALSVQIGDSKVEDSWKGSPRAQLKRDGFAQEYLASDTRFPTKQTKQVDDDDAKIFTPIQTGPRERFELLRNIKEPQQREEERLFIPRLQQSSTSQDKEREPDISVLSLATPLLELPHYKKTYSDVCKGTTERRPWVEEIAPIGHSPIQTAGVEAVIHNRSAALTKSPGNEHDTSDATWHYEGLQHFQDLGESSDDEAEASKWEWNTGGTTWKPRKTGPRCVSTRFLKHCGPRSSANRVWLKKPQAK